MKQTQVEYGKQRLAEVAEDWGVPIAVAARILEGSEYRQFFEWVNAVEFLEDGLWRKPTPTIPAA